jgi:hypothetical protein
LVQIVIGKETAFRVGEKLVVHQKLTANPSIKSR